MKRESLWLGYKDEDKKKLEEVCSLYKTCLDEGKTERECVDLIVKMADIKSFLQRLNQERSWKRAISCMWFR